MREINSLWGKWTVDVGPWASTCLPSRSFLSTGLVVVDHRPTPAAATPLTPKADAGLCSSSGYRHTEGKARFPVSSPFLPVFLSGWEAKSGQLESLQSIFSSGVLDVDLTHLRKLMRQFAGIKFSRLIWSTCCQEYKPKWQPAPSWKLHGLILREMESEQGHEDLSTCLPRPCLSITQTPVAFQLVCPLGLVLQKAGSIKLEVEPSSDLKLLGKMLSVLEK